MPEWLNIVLRSLSFFVLLFIVVRLMGRKVAARMTNFEVLLTVVMGEIAAAVSLNLVKNALYGFLTLAVWALVTVAVTYLTLKSKWFHDFFRGRELVVVKNGKIMEDQLKKMRYTPEELLQQLRSKQVFNMADVEFAVMEADGEVNVLLKSERQPLTAKDLGAQTLPAAGVQTVILDGNVIDEHLATIGLNRRWLKTELDKIGVSAENVFIGQVDGMGELYLDLFDDAIQIPKPSTRQLLLATLEKASADLASFALDTEQRKAKVMYQRCSEELRDVIRELAPLLK